MILNKQTLLVFSFSVAKNSVNLSKNYYKILEVQSGCDQKIIKNSYLKLVKSLHPDVNPNGKQKFTQVQQAYEVLSDQQLKKYYDQNHNSCKNSNQNFKQNGPQKHSNQSQSYQTNGGHQYYTHRTYASENPYDYFYTDNEPKNERKNTQNKKQKEEQYENDWEENENKSNFNKNRKYARDRTSWQQYQKQNQQEKYYERQTPQQRQMRDKIKAMRGFTSSYNVLWGRHHIRHTDITGREQWQKKKQEQIRNLMPQKVRKFYDKLMDKLQKIAQQ